MLQVNQHAGSYKLAVSQITKFGMGKIWNSRKRSDLYKMRIDDLQEGSENICVIKRVIGKKSEDHAPPRLKNITTRFRSIRIAG